MASQQPALGTVVDRFLLMQQRNTRRKLLPALCVSLKHLFGHHCKLDEFDIWCDLAGAFLPLCAKVSYPPFFNMREERSAGRMMTKM